MRSINEESKTDEEQTESSEAKNRKRAWRGKEVQRRHEPRKNYIRVSKFAVWPPDPGKSSPCFSLRLQASAILSPCSEFWFSIKNIWLLHPPKTFFFEKSQHDKIVYNDTLTICIKRLFNSWNCGFVTWRSLRHMTLYDIKWRHITPYCVICQTSLNVIWLIFLWL